MINPERKSPDHQAGPRVGGDLSPGPFSGDPGGCHFRDDSGGAPATTSPHAGCGMSLPHPVRPSPAAFIHQTTNPPDQSRSRPVLVGPDQVNFYENKMFNGT
jgi:hypothetical protein